MKKVLLIAALVALMASPAFAQIAGSKHDFSGAAWNSTGKICIVCHAPHNASQVVTNAPLWNHSTTQVATFQLYAGNGTFNGSATIGQPGGVSKLCLSCHDGTVALDNFSGNTTGTNMLTGTALLDSDLTNDHPISFTYDSNLATTDGGLFDPATQASGLGGTIAADMLFSNSLECGSCHDVHDNTNGTFLVKSNAASALCLTCHDK